MDKEQENKIELGVFLQKERKNLNLEINEICQKLNVKAKDIEAIESQNWDFLNQKSYVVGLINSYSKLLKIDEKIIKEEIKKLPIKSNIKDTKHKLVNIGENLDLTPDKDFFFNFLVASIILFFIFLSIYNSKEDKSDLLKIDHLSKKVEDIGIND